MSGRSGIPRARRGLAAGPSAGDRAVGVPRARRGPLLTRRLHALANDPPPPAHAEGGTAASRILDAAAPSIRALAACIAAEAGVGRPSAAGTSAGAFLRRAHADVRLRVRAAYGLEERRPASRTLRLGRGSCSQRLAVLEALARAAGIASRSRGLLVDGSFWAARFPALRPVLPELVLLAWPEFRAGPAADPWLDAADLFPRTGTPSPSATTGPRRSSRRSAAVPPSGGRGRDAPGRAWPGPCGGTSASSAAGTSCSTASAGICRGPCAGSPAPC